MSQAEATLLVVSGRRGVLRKHRVLVNGTEAGAVGEELHVSPGRIAVAVRAPGWTCNEVSVEARPGARIRLEYRGTSFGLAALFALGLFYFCGLGVASLTIDGLAGLLPEGWGAARGPVAWVTVAVLVGVVCWLVLRVLRWAGGLGIVTHRLTVLRVE
jgi:hypothetical protein